MHLKFQRLNKSHQRTGHFCCLRKMTRIQISFSLNSLSYFLNFVGRREYTFLNNKKSRKTKNNNHRREDKWGRRKNMAFNIIWHSNPHNFFKCRCNAFFILTWIICKDSKDGSSQCHERFKFLNFSHFRIHNAAFTYVEIGFYNIRYM